MTIETDIQNRLRLEASALGAGLMRNNSGACQDAKSGRLIRYGLGNDSKRLNDHFKSSDLIGITPVQSTAAGQWFGVFTAIEVKAPGWTPRAMNEREIAQQRFIDYVLGLRGIAGFCTSVEDYRRLLGR